MNDDTTTICQLRQFARFDYRYQLDDTLASLEPITESKVADLHKALKDGDSDVRFLAARVLDELEPKTVTGCCEPRLTVEQLIALLREPHPDHEFFDPEPDANVQGKLRSQYSPDAIQHVALCELVEHRAKDAIDDILKLMNCSTTSEEVRQHCARAVFDITGSLLFSPNLTLDFTGDGSR